LPCLALAQYPSNGNQKITLGEQTTADGLIYRGVAADTTLTAKSDTAAYFVLDTVNINLYTYKASATGRKWRQLGADTASIAYVNTYGTQTVNGAKTFTSALTATRFDPTSSSASGNGMFLPTTNTLGLSTAGVNRMTINNVGSVGIGTSPGNFSGLSFANPFFDVAGNMQLKGTTANGNSNLSMGGSTFRKAGIFTSIDGQSPYLSFYVASNYNSSIVSLLMYGDSLQRLGIGTLIPTEKLHVNGNARITANIAAGITTATARLHLAAGTATASTAPLKFTSQGASLLNPVEAGAVEFNGTNLLFTPSTTRYTVSHGLTGSATLNFPSTNAQLSADLTITVTGAADGDVVSLGVPNAAVNANTSYSAWVSAANTVTVRFNNYSSGTVDPASALFKVFVTK
jgi:hypothetical protein